MVEIEKPSLPKWRYLVEHTHAWRKQLYVKGRKLPAAVVWNSTLVNKITREEAADDWDLPVEAVDEIFEYCGANKALLQMEAEEELRRIEEMGVGRGS